MKSFRWTLATGLAMAGLVSFTVYDYQRSTRNQERKERDEYVLHIGPEEATKIEILNRAGGEIALEKKDGRWHLTSPLHDEADQQAVENYLSTLESEKILETVASGSGVDLNVYGLVNPPTRIKIQGGAVQSQEIKIGSVKAYDSNLYAQRDSDSSESKVFLVDANWDLHLTKQADEFRDKRLYRGEGKPEEIRRLEISRNTSGNKPGNGPGSSDLVFIKEKDDWKLLKGGDGFPIRSKAVADYVDQLRSLKGRSFVGSKTDRQTLVKHGLTSPTLSLRMFAENDGNSEPLFQAEFAKADAAETFATSTDRNEILSILPSNAGFVFKGPQDFYDESRPFQFALAEVGRMKIEGPELNAEFVKKDGAWESDRVAETIEMLSRTEAVRILGSEASKESFGGESKIMLSKADGEKIFEFTWGKSTVDKDGETGLEVKYHPASTSAVDRQIRVTERSVEALGLTALKELSKPDAVK